MKKQITEDVEGCGGDGVHIKAKDDGPLVTIATFDGDERVSEWKAALQKEDEIWFAEGYLEAKENYKEPYQKL